MLPKSRSSVRIEGAIHVSVTLAAATVGGAFMDEVVNEVLVVAIQSSREVACLARSGKGWE